MEKIVKKYSNTDITVVWQPEICIHSTICWKNLTGLPTVFNPKVKPWINLSGSQSSEIINQIKKCPSGALSYYLNNEEEEEDVIETGIIVEISKDGPLLVYGNIVLKDKNGTETKRNKVSAFCRCGASESKPFCDGTHKKINFKDNSKDEY